MYTDKQTALDSLSVVEHVTDSEWIRFTCPFCYERTGKADKRESMGYNRESGVCHCFKCKKKLKLDVYEVNKILGKRISMPEVRHYSPEEAAQPPEKFTPLWCKPGIDDLWLKPARDFLDKRGISRDIWGQVGIGACAFGKQATRIIIPIRNKDDTAWAGWVGRTWHNNTNLKYIYSKGFRRDSHLLNHSAIYIETDEPVLIVEGSLDALPYWPHGVAVLGRPAKNHLNLLKHSRRPIAVCLDGDAWQEGWAFAQKLKLQKKYSFHFYSMQ